MERNIRPLKLHSTQELESALAEAFGKLTGSKYSVEISNCDFLPTTAFTDEAEFRIKVLRDKDEIIAQNILPLMSRI
jgi:hypothetical protein